MRHLVWLSGVLLALSCAVDNSNLNVDAGGTGGAAGSGAAGGSTGAGGSAAGSTGAGGSAAGSTGVGGSASGGQTGAGGNGTGGNATGTGGSGTGGSGTGGNGTGGNGTGGNGTGGKGTGGKGAGGTTGTGGKGGQGGSPSCDTIATEYSTALGQAKVCTPGAAGQCQQMVDSSISCPGCKTYVNDTTMLNTIEAEWTAAGCASMHFVCPAIACVLPGNSTCAAIATGGGPGSTGMCVNALTPAGTN
jgi:hypothetical protein